MAPAEWIRSWVTDRTFVYHEEQLPSLRVLPLTSTQRIANAHSSTGSGHRSTMVTFSFSLLLLFVLFFLLLLVLRRFAIYAVSSHCYCSYCNYCNCYRCFCLVLLTQTSRRTPPDPSPPHRSHIQPTRDGFFAAEGPQEREAAFPRKAKTNLPL